MKEEKEVFRDVDNYPSFNKPLEHIYELAYVHPLREDYERTWALPSNEGRWFYSIMVLTLN